MDNKFMSRALLLAREAGGKGDVPVGAVIVKDGKIIGEGGNTREIEFDITGHAEINAIRSAARYLKSWRLDGCDIYVTLEPCPMCAAAISASRIDNVYFGAYDKRAGAVESMTRLYDLPLEHRPEFYGGIMEEETANLLKDFFKAKREDR